MFLARRTDGTVPELVAVKRMRPSMAQDFVMKQRFEREGRVSALLRHPNIVSMLEYGEDVEGPYLAFEYVEGHSAARLLASALQKHEHLPLAVALSILVDAARGLCAAHECVEAELGIEGIVHRDFTPDNILVGYDGVARVLDFGIAWLSGNTELTGTGKVIGKAGFIAPEAYEGHDVDFRSDIFSFGATAFRLLSGVAPFQAQSEAGMMRAVISVTPPRINVLRPDIPVEVADVVAHCLEKNPQRRPAHMREISARLEAVLATMTPEPRLKTAELLSGWLPSSSKLKALPAVHAEAMETPSRHTVAAQVPHAPSRGWWGAGIVAVLGVMATVFWYVGSTEQTPVVQPEVRQIEEPEVIPQPPAIVSPSVVEPETPTPAVPHPVPTKPPLAVRQAGLRIRVKPYADIFVDGRPLGQTPVPDQKLAPGLHSIIVVNNELGVRKSYQLRLKAGEQRNFSVDLSR